MSYMSPERSFLHFQNLAISEYDKNKRQQEKEIHKLLAKDYAEDMRMKSQQRRMVKEFQVKEEQDRLRQLEAAIRADREAKAKHKLKWIHNQQLNIQNDIFEKARVQQKKEREFNRDKQIIEFNMKDLLRKENSFQEFYYNRMAKISEKRRDFKPTSMNDQFKWDFINKSNAEHMRKVELEEIQKKKEEFERSQALKNQMKSTLELQIHQRKNKERLEQLEMLRQKRETLQAAHEFEIEQQRKIIQRKRLMKEMKDSLDLQVKEKRFKIDRNLSSDLKNYKFYSLDRSYAFDQYATLNPRKHNPLFNPIGEEHPKVIPGQRTTHRSAKRIGYSFM